MEGLSFEAAHYTPIKGIPTLHGHTFKLTVCVEGPVGKNDMVIDFNILRKIAEDIVSKYNYSLIIPKGDRAKLPEHLPFLIRAVEVDGLYATAEVIASDICSELRGSLHSFKELTNIEIELYEGDGNKVISRCL